MGSTITKGGKNTAYKDAIAIKVKCKKKPHTVQFIYREIIGANGKPVSRTMKTTGGQYQTTTDVTKPNWNTDSAAKPAPHYESGGAASSDADGLTIYDQPSLMPSKGETWRATFKTFLICDGNVIREVTWARSQKHGDIPKYDVKVKETTALPDWAKQQLKAQGYNVPK